MLSRVTISSSEGVCDLTKYLVSCFGTETFSSVEKLSCSMVTLPMIPLDSCLRVSLLFFHNFEYFHVERSIPQLRVSAA